MIDSGQPDRSERGPGSECGHIPEAELQQRHQYIASIPQPTHVREDVVRIDHAINSKFQLMGHYLHDTLAAKLFPAVVGRRHYPTVGTTMTNPSYTAAIKLTQTYSPNLLNETAFFYSGNKITLTPITVPAAHSCSPAGGRPPVSSRSAMRRPTTCRRSICRARR